MTGFSTDADRRVIPRWRTYDETRRLGELGSIAQPRAHQEVIADFLASKMAEWRRNRTLGHASDLVGAGLTLGREADIIDAAKFLLRDDISVSPWARELAEQALKAPQDIGSGLEPRSIDKITLHAQVRTLRDLLRSEPNDPISWVDLARAYACLGLGDQAKRSMTIALQLGGNNRFVLRSAGRLWISQDDPERAHSVFTQSDRTRHDPWLLSAEIAIGSIAGRPSRLVKPAQRMLLGQQFLPGQLSELASAVATLELNHGGVRKSKRLFRQSLEDPTENSIAQAAWAARRHRGIDFDHELLNLPNTFEAKAWTFYQQGQWKLAVENCKLWLLDQPFSSRPSIQGSFLAAVALEDYELSEYFAKQGLLANPSDSTLLNNWAFTLINRKDIDQARSALSKVRNAQVSRIDKVILEATRGLLEYRTGNIQLGRELYSNALSMAEKVRGREGSTLLALASAFHAMEEASIVATATAEEVEEMRSLLAKAIQFVKKAPVPLSILFEEKITKIVQLLDEEICHSKSV